MVSDGRQKRKSTKNNWRVKQPQENLAGNNLWISETLVSETVVMSLRRLFFMLLIASPAPVHLIGYLHLPSATGISVASLSFGTLVVAVAQ